LDRERWQQVRELFDRALDLEPEARAAFLEEACADDADLRREVESLLAAEAASADTLAVELPTTMLREAIESATPELPPADRWAGLRLGAWRLDREIGRGGMGSVYLAHRADGQYMQRAAVKLVRPGWDVEGLVARLRSERQILAQLEHPNIARLLDGGISEDGRPYLVLEYVDGLDLIAYCDHARLDIRARLELFLTVCEAVEYAHRKLIVHRDLKPSNIMVDTHGQVKLLDFGIAKLLQEGEEDHTATRIFTPEYAAPEQLRGDPVTTSVDVHALGVILFELLTGAHPYPVDTPTPAAYSQAVLTGEPTAPSRAASDTSRQGRILARRRRMSPAALSGRLRGDLDAIVLKALRKDPAQRYSSVEALANDVRAYLAHRPVSARRGRLRYRAGRFLRRNALACSLAAVAVLALAGGLLLALYQAEQVREQRDRARIEAENAQAVSEFLAGILEEANPERNDGRPPSIREAVDKALERIDRAEGMRDAVRARLLLAMGKAYHGLGEHAVAQSVLERALATAGAGGEPLLLAEVHRNLADGGLYAGRYDLAYRHAQERLRILEEAGVDDPEVMIPARMKVGTTLFRAGPPAEAVRILEPLHAEISGHYGPASDLMAELLPAFASALTALGRVDEAVAITRASYQALQEEPERSLVVVTLILNAHVHALRQAGLEEEAEPVAREYLDKVTRLYGAEDTRTSVAMGHLAQVLGRLGRHEEAVGLMEQSVAIRRRNLEADNPRLAVQLLSLGQLLLEAGQLQRALDTLAEAHGIFARRGEGEGRAAVEAMLVQAQVRERLGQWSDALALVEQVLPFTDAGAGYYPGKSAARPLLLQARLLHRLHGLPPDCQPVPRVLAIAGLDRHHEQEARILAAYCARRNGRHDEADTLLATLDQEALDDRITALAHELLLAARR